MAIEFMIEKSSTPFEIDSAYQSCAFAYRNIVFDYARTKGFESIFELAKESGCKYPEIVEKFIRDGKVIPTGRDLYRLIENIGLKREWLENISNIQVHASWGNSKPSNIRGRTRINEKTDLAIRQAINKQDWFYNESSIRFYLQNQEK